MLLGLDGRRRHRPESEGPGRGSDPGEAERKQARLKENKCLPSSITLVREALQTVADIPFSEAVKIVGQSDALKPPGYQGRPLVAVHKGPTSSGVTRTIVARTSFDVF